jgi:hypothetical protein
MRRPAVQRALRTCATLHAAMVTWRQARDESRQMRTAWARMSMRRLYAGWITWLGLSVRAAPSPDPNPDPNPNPNPNLARPLPARLTLTLTLTLTLILTLPPVHHHRAASLMLRPLCRTLSPASAVRVLASLYAPLPLSLCQVRNMRHRQLLMRAQQYGVVRALNTWRDNAARSAAEAASSARAAVANARDGMVDQLQIVVDSP